MRPIHFNKLKESKKLFLIAGPCVVESKDVLFKTAEHLCKVTEALDIPLIFKSSFKKANRSSITSFTGIGDEKALELLHLVREKFSVPVITDVHSESDCILASNYVDILQIPAFLCRQTDLLKAAAKTNKVINIKKGQFMNALAMKFAIDKVKHFGNENILVTERGNSFGYEDLIVDFRNIPIMQAFNVPVIMDCTHAIQKPNQTKGITSGTPEFVPSMVYAACAVGTDGLFIETHPEPSQAKSDGANMLALDDIEHVLKKAKAIHTAFHIN